MNCSRLLNPHFIGVVVIILLNWFVFVFMFMLDLKPKPYLIFLIIYNVLFILLVWSMARSILSDPGRVPIYWGFFAEEAQNRKRRYCLLCHSFKPERCHHCSTCQRCVLNMDHHCPWIANCVGFSNRKYFILFLFYIIVTVVFSLCIEIPLLVEQVLSLIHGEISVTAPFILRALAVLFKIGFFFAIILFFKFHIGLVLENSSTLDNLERQRNPNAGPNVYDIGAYENFVQVFGTNTCLWPIPVAPVFANRANGVIWPRNQ